MSSKTSEIIIEKIRLNLGKPIHGWLPIEFSYEDYTLELEVSDVPIDPVDQLRSALMILAVQDSETKDSQEVIFHLEPVCYYFVLERIENHVNISISRSNEYDGKRELLKKITVTFKEIMLPLYRSLMNFYSYQYQEPHWPETEPIFIEKLKKRIQDSKT